MTEPNIPLEQLKKLIQTGIPVQEAHFHNAVNNADNTPETSFNEKSLRASRRIEMWATSADLLVYRQNDKILFTPMANVKFGVFKTEIQHQESYNLAAVEAHLDNATAKKRGRPFKVAQES